MSRQSSSSSSSHKVVGHTRPVTSNTHQQPMQDFSRVKYLRLPSQPLHIPIPPSLLQSPHLSSPQSIFRRAVSAPRLPSEEDEEWLRDTVPLSLEIRNGEKNTSANSPRPSLSHGSESTKGERHLRGRNSELRMLSNAPPSPALICSRRAATPTFEQSNIRSEPNIPCIAQQGYFVSEQLA